jgi:hypothetical protein
VVPACRVREVALELPESGNIGPGFVTACGSAMGKGGCTVYGSKGQTNTRTPWEEMSTWQYSSRCLPSCSTVTFH